MTFQEVFDFAYGSLVPVLQGLAQELGKERFLEALKEVASESALKAAKDSARQLPCNDTATIVLFGKTSQSVLEFGHSVAVARPADRDWPAVAFCSGAQRYELILPYS